MKIIVFICVAFLAGLTLSELPRLIKEQQTSPTSVTQLSHANQSNSLPKWHEWFQDKRFAPLDDKVSNLEGQLKIMTETEKHRVQQLNTLKERLTRLEENNEKSLTKQRVQILEEEKERVYIEQGSVLAKSGDKNWKLANIFSKLRRYQQPIQFEQVFPIPPKVMLSISQIHFPKENTHFLSKASEITKTGFTLVLETRSDSRLDEVQVDWLALIASKSQKQLQQKQSENVAP